MTIYEPQCPIDRETDKVRGFRFVEMFESAEEDAAILALDGAEWLGRSLGVNKAKPKTNNREVRSGGRGRY
jgi:RNA recognition motif-containing protein